MEHENQFKPDIDDSFYIGNAGLVLFHLNWRRYTVSGADMQGGQRALADLPTGRQACAH